MKLIPPYQLPAPIESPVMDVFIGAVFAVAGFCNPNPAVATTVDYTVGIATEQPSTPDNRISLSELADDKQDVIKRLNGFRTLKDNWDGYGALAVVDAAYNNAMSIVERVDADSLHRWNFFPSVNGTILMTVKGRRLSTIDIGANRFSAYASEFDGDNFIDVTADFNPVSVAGLIKEIEHAFGLA